MNDLGGTVAGTGGSRAVADAVVEEITAAGGEAVANYDTVATQEGGQRVIHTALDAFGTVDILINNAGNVWDKSFAKMDLDDFRSLIDVHLMGAVYCTHAAWPIMREKGFGRVVMTTSSAGLYGNHGHTNYGTAKMALIGLHELPQRSKGSAIRYQRSTAIAGYCADAYVPEPCNHTAIRQPLMKPEFVTRRSVLPGMCAILRQYRNSQGILSRPGRARNSKDFS